MSGPRSSPAPNGLTVDGIIRDISKILLCFPVLSDDGRLHQWNRQKVPPPPPTKSN